ncbi:MAG: spore coat polysaccharide biosynthesis protein F [Rhodospirillales bacterium]|nr:MAG: spore coat polysaccharide biosynthesis protein F [Rhodospirillales bacterium]
MSRKICIVQARMSSTRLPGKVLLPLGDKAVLAHVLSRCLRISGIDDVCCATTTLPSDDEVAAEAERLGVRVFRGSESDVLQRYADAADAMNADVILRVTADCPLLDPGVCAGTLALFEETSADFATNNTPPSWPHGLDCEVFGRELLCKAADEAEAPFDREHVTPFMRRLTNICQVNYPAPRQESQHRWTVDTPDDLAFLERLFSLPGFESKGMTCNGVLELLESNPDLCAQSLDSIRAGKVADTRHHAIQSGSHAR